jgi:hypothetical protein
LQEAVLCNGTVAHVALIQLMQHSLQAFRRLTTILQRLSLQQVTAMAQAAAGCTTAASLDTAADKQQAVQWTPEQEHFMQLALHQVNQATVHVTLS